MNRVESGNHKTQMQSNCPIANDTYGLKVTPHCDVSHLSIPPNDVYFSFLLCVLFIPHLISFQSNFFFFSSYFNVVIVVNAAASVLSIDFVRENPQQKMDLECFVHKSIFIFILKWTWMSFHTLNLILYVKIARDNLKVLRQNTYTRSHSQVYIFYIRRQMNTKKNQQLITQ